MGGVFVPVTTKDKMAGNSKAVNLHELEQRLANYHATLQHLSEADHVGMKIRIQHLREQIENLRNNVEVGESFSA
jgi:hypothetical protein